MTTGRIPVIHKLARAASTLLALSGLAWIAASAPASVEAAGSCDVADASVDGEEQAFLQLLNDYRARHGAGPLSIDGALTRAATWMANDLAGSSGFGHTDSSGRSPWTRMPACGVGSPGGENLAAGTHYSSASTALNAWINSPAHNNVMLEPSFGTIGIARVNRPGSHYGWYWVTDFGYGGGQPAAAAPPPPPPPAPAAESQRAAPAPAAPAPPPPAAVEVAPEPVYLGIPAGQSLVTWDGGYRSLDEVFAGREEQVAMVYVFDLGSETWLRWGPVLDPSLRTLTELRTGVSYWVIASEEVWVGMD